MASNTANSECVYNAQTSNTNITDTCLQLALEGEKLCKAGNCGDGIAFFEAALQTGTDDFRTLSAIYSQLGNAYFYIGDYMQAMQYHKHDLTLARTMGDKLGEAKASGNLGNTLKVLGKFEEALTCCRKHLAICQEEGDKVGIGRALYNLGNVYHAKGKHIGRLGQQDPGEFPEEVKTLFDKAVQYYEENLALMIELNDRAAQGRAFGNLGNVHYLLGNFSKAVHYHLERLSIAREFSDNAAERRAHSNLGNAHIFLGQFEEASKNYKETLKLAKDLKDSAVEAQACYSLGNTYTLLKDYPTAIEYHMQHLKIAQELFDKVGEGRAYWSLGNAHSAMGQHKEAFRFAQKHLEISRETGDRMGQATAQLNLSELSKTLGFPDTSGSSSSQIWSGTSSSDKLSCENNMNQKKLLLEGNSGEKISTNSAKNMIPHSGSTKGSKLFDECKKVDEEDFFDIISKFQSKRMDDQRCSLNVDPQINSRDLSVAENCRDPEEVDPRNKEELMDMIAGIQCHRMNEQRASIPYLPGFLPHKQNSQIQQINDPSTSPRDLNFPDDSFFEMLMRSHALRIEDQRTFLPAPEVIRKPLRQAPTMPDDDFFSLVLKFQSNRLEDQRASLPSNSTSPLQT